MSDNSGAREGAVRGAAARLLIVDDDAADRAALRRALRRSTDNFEVHEAASLEEGLEKFTRLEPDCILLDQHLSPSTGIDFLEWIAAKGDVSHTPVIMITADDSQRLGVDAMRLGVAELIAKRALPDVDLCAMVMALLELRDMRRDEARRVYSERLQSLGRLVAQAVHEINNPATIVRLALARVGESLRKDGPGITLRELSRLLELVTSADQALERIGMVARDLEDKAGLALGRYEKLSFNAVLEDARHRIEQSPRRRGRVELIFESERLFPGDRAQLKRAIVDLVENAFEAIGLHGLVRISALSAEHAAELIVEDDGPGIDGELRDSIFEPFFTTHTERGALGMGLSRASAIAERHGGRLSVERSPLGGARFVFRVQLEDTPDVAAPRSVPPPSSGIIGRPRVLIVDDEPQIRDSYRRILRLKFDVEVASNSREAYDLIRSGAFDMVLCDVVMPEEDGVSFAERLRRDFPTQAAALLFCTGGVLESEQERFLSSWQNGYLRKPLSADQLLASASAFLEPRSSGRAG
jgi:two-component system, NtrC family, sensor kinase